MNVAIDYTNVNLNSIFFTEKKKNIVVDGTFTKIMYSTDCLTLNGVYVRFPSTQRFVMGHYDIGVHSHSTVRTVPMIKYTDYMCKLEDAILRHYQDGVCIQKNNAYTLRSCLVNGNIKLHNADPYNTEPKDYLLKISGIWETASTVGITYKLSYNTIHTGVNYSSFVADEMASWTV